MVLGCDRLTLNSPEEAVISDDNSPMQLSSLAKGKTKPATQRHPMRVTIADRVGDNVLSDSTSSGTNVYTDGVDCISEITDKTKDPDVFSIQVGTPVNRQRFIRLQIPGVVEEDSCGYGAIHVRNSSDFFNMSVRSSRPADGVVECYERANKNDGWRVTYTSCIIIEHPVEGVWLFRAGGQDRQKESYDSRLLRGALSAGCR